MFVTQHHSRFQAHAYYFLYEIPRRTKWRFTCGNCHKVWNRIATMKSDKPRTLLQKAIELTRNPYFNGMRIDYYALFRILQFLSSSMAFLRWICVCVASWFTESMGSIEHNRFIFLHNLHIERYVNKIRFSAFQSTNIDSQCRITWFVWNNVGNH